MHSAKIAGFYFDCCTVIYNKTGLLHSSALLRSEYW